MKLILAMIPLLIILTGCTTTSVIDQTEIKYLKPPSVLLICENPKPEKIDTNRDLLKYIDKLRKSNHICHNSINSLREYFRGY